MSGRSFIYRHTVTFEETNLVGNVYFAHFVRWQGHCREHFLATHAPGVVAALADNLALVTVSCAVDYLAECHALDEIEVHMTLAGTNGHRIDMEFGYHRGGGGGLTPVARGRQTVACMRRGDRGLEPVPVPQELRRALEGYTTSFSEASL